MADRTVQPSVALIFAEMERRIRVLETAAQLGLSSIRGGGLTIYDDNGVKAAKLGKIISGANEAGAEFYDTLGNSLLRVGRIGGAGNEVSLRAIGTDGGFDAHIGRLQDYSGGGTRTGVRVNDQFFNTALLAAAEAGWEKPMLSLDTRKGDDFYSTTSTSYLATWRAENNYCFAGKCRIEAFVNADAGTSADFRVLHNAAYSATQSIGSGGSAILVWHWNFGLGYQHAFTVEARRSAGAGAVRVYNPIIQLGTPPAPTTATGI